MAKLIFNSHYFNTLLLNKSIKFLTKKILLNLNVLHLNICILMFYINVYLVQLNYSTMGKGI